MLLAVTRLRGTITIVEGMIYSHDSPRPESMSRAYLETVLSLDNTIV